MTALELAKKREPSMEEGRIIRYGCPDRYGVGMQPDWCRRAYDDGETTSIEQCWECWQQEAVEGSEADGRGGEEAQGEV